MLPFEQGYRYGLMSQYDWILLIYTSKMIEKTKRK